MRFTIRDLLWAMVVVGLSLGWWIEHRSVRATLVENRALRDGLQGTLDAWGYQAGGIGIPLLNGEFMHSTAPGNQFVDNPALSNSQQKQIMDGYWKKVRGDRPAPPSVP